MKSLFLSVLTIMVLLAVVNPFGIPAQAEEYTTKVLFPSSGSYVGLVGANTSADSTTLGLDCRYGHRVAVRTNVYSLGSSTSLTLKLQGSWDNVHWITLGNIDTLASGRLTSNLVLSREIPGAAFVATTGGATTGIYVLSIMPPYIRVNWDKTAGSAADSVGVEATVYSSK